MTQHIRARYKQLTNAVDRSKQVDYLNEVFTPLTFEQRIEKLYEIFEEREVLMTSSFGTKSVFLLYWLHKIHPTQLIHFIDTTYHFSETITYKNQLTELLGLNVKNVVPHSGQNKLTRDEEWWNDHPRMCCTINKIAPLEPIVSAHEIWISGLMAYQTSFRANLRVFELQGDIIKFHPLIDIDEGEFLFHLEANKLPRHPLEAEGFGSIGCTHCTEIGEGREGRFATKENKECGLHPNYFTRKKDA